jgi:hypothetical protein
MPSINCQRCGEPFARAKLKGGPRQRYCSSRCRTAAHRDTRPPAPTENIEEFGELRYTNGRTATQSLPDVKGPRAVIRAEISDSREWTEVISSDGVKSYVSRIAKPALRERAE